MKNIPRAAPGHRHVFASTNNLAPGVAFALRFRAARVIHCHARKAAQKRMIRIMSNAETTEKSATVAEPVPPKKSLKRKPKTPQKRSASKQPAKPTAPRAESKGAKILDLIGRARGATLAELMKATGWQAHSVRGFLSTAAKKKRLKIDSSKSEAGNRVYCAAK